MVRLSIIHSRAITLISYLPAIAEAGFNKKMVAEGLRQTNNDELATMTLLTETPELLKTNKKAKPFATEEKVIILTGFLPTNSPFLS